MSNVSKINGLSFRLKPPGSVKLTDCVVAPSKQLGDDITRPDAV